MENNMSNWEKELILDDVIEATKNMDGQEYMVFMGLAGPERLKRVVEILKEREE